jgi:hypothetical protein
MLFMVRPEGRQAGLRTTFTAEPRPSTATDVLVNLGLAG